MEKRVKFDFEIEFTNGGGIQGKDFRLDIAGEEIRDKELADYLVKDMRLLMVGEVRILNKEYLNEAHKQKAINNSGTISRYIDLSHTIEDGLITYKGLPGPIICDYLSRESSRQFYELGTEFQIGKIEMVTNTGTYLDCPFHRYANGEDLSQVALEKMVDLEGIVIRADYRNGIAVEPDILKGKEIRNKAVLIHTNWAEHWQTEQYFYNHSFLTEESARYLAACGVTLVGIDSHNIDDTRGNARPVHSTLLKEGILIVEHACNLDKLPDEGFLFSALPPKFKGVGTFPVRAIAKLQKVS